MKIGRRVHLARNDAGLTWGTALDARKQATYPSVKLRATIHERH